MFPLRDSQPSYSKPVVTVLLIVINILVFLFEVSLEPFARNEFIAAYGMVPDHFSFISLLTSMFLHGGWMHVLGNMWFLWIFGDNIEDTLGSARFLLFYLLCGAAAAMAQYLADPGSRIPMVGASGAIAGVMGAYLVLYPRSRVITLIPLFVFWEVIEVPAVVLLGFWFLMQLFSAGAVAVTAGANGSGGVAFAAHVAGFLVGMAGVFLFRKREEPEARWV
jgi:membrane associated rhomboid family serine protease